MNSTFAQSHLIDVFCGDLFRPVHKTVLWHLAAVAISEEPRQRREVLLRIQVQQIRQLAPRLHREVEREELQLLAREATNPTP